MQAGTLSATIRHSMAEQEHSISLGGSLLYEKTQTPEIRTDFIRDLSSLFIDFSQQGYRFHIICGGGKLARIYRDAARKLGVVDSRTLDNLGVIASHINAKLFGAALRSLGAEALYQTDPYRKKDVLISVSGGYGVGHTTDYVAVKTSILYGLSEIVNLTDVPGIHPQAGTELDKSKIISQLTWTEFTAMQKEIYAPGMSTPFDPIAAIEAQKNKITAVILSGSDLLNFECYLKGETFKGTVITP